MSDGPRWPHCDGMHLLLTSLGAVVVDTTGVRSLRAQDASGSFGLWPGHADFLTVLGVGVLSWRAADDRWRHCAVRRGVLTLRRGCELSIATREAVPGDDLERLEHEVRGRLAERQHAEDEARRQERQLALRAMRELLRSLRPRPPGLPP
jgi:F-type H+-transporting ATPase subunit epsilon